MLITCNNCTTSYEIEPCSFGLTGRSVRCIRCGHTWFAANMAALGAIAKIHRVELGLPPEPLVEEPRENPPESPVIEAEPVELAPEQAPGLGADTDATGWQTTASVARPDRSVAAYWDLEQRGFGQGDLGQPQSPSEPQDERIHTTVAASARADVNAPQPAVTARESSAQARESAARAREHSARPRHATEPAAAVRSRSKKPERSWRQNISLFLAIIVLVALHASLVRWRTEVVRILPQTASLYAAVGLPVNLRGLDFTDVQTTSTQNDGIAILVVEGSIVNSTSRKIDVPRLNFSVRNERGLEIYNWAAPAPKPALQPGETLPFRSRLASPPPEMHRVVVRFRNRRDLVAGLN